MTTSPREAPLLTCVAKRRYHRQEYAERVIQKMLAKHMPGAERCHVYWCWHCHGYHVGRVKGWVWETPS